MLGMRKQQCTTCPIQLRSTIVLAHKALFHCIYIVSDLSFHTPNLCHSLSGHSKIQSANLWRSLDGHLSWFPMHCQDDGTRVYNYKDIYTAQGALSPSTKLQKLKMKANKWIHLAGQRHAFSIFKFYDVGAVLVCLCSTGENRAHTALPSLGSSWAYVNV